MPFTAADHMDPHLTKADKVVLQRLFDDLARSPDPILEEPHAIKPVMNVLPRTTTTRICRKCSAKCDNSDESQFSEEETEVIASRLEALNDPEAPSFEPTLFTGWDVDATAGTTLLLPLLSTYTKFATTIVRHPTDVVFLTHLLLYLSTIVPSAILLFRRWTFSHAVIHILLVAWSAGSFTILMHNHIHSNGVLNRKLWWLDKTVPYLLYPLMGHTWNSYYYHHLKMHHVEGNGPDDLSSTLRYQRDSIIDFLIYVIRFMLLIWIELPFYFLQKHQFKYALSCFATEVFSYSTILLGLVQPQLRSATITVFLLPLILARIVLMVGNWGQHAFIDELEPTSDYRSSITLIDVASNRYCFNDGYHTSHHLNPRRHWRDHPAHFIRNRKRYKKEEALVFRDIDYLMITVRLLRGDYGSLAKCWVPLGGEQAKWTEREVVEMLKRKTRRFTEKEIEDKFGKTAGMGTEGGTV